MLEPLFNACNFIKKRLQNRCFTVNIAKILRTHFLWNTSGGCLCAVLQCEILGNELGILT